MAVQKSQQSEVNPWPERLAAWNKFSEKFHDRGKNIEARYEDERQAEASGRPSGLGDTGLKKVNMFYSNTTVIKESLYNSLPTPDVSRLHKGEFENEPARVAATIMERGLAYEIRQAPFFDTALKAAILDRLVPGLGVVWMEFRPPSADGKMPEMIGVEIVYWKDFLYEPRRAWEQVTWAGRILHVDKQEATTKWGPKVNVSAPNKNTGMNIAAETVNEGKVNVIQMWDKTKKEVLHLTMDGQILDRNPDAYQLRDFFPCPKPLLASPPTNKFLPTPDYYIAQDQYMELDILYARINLIIEAVRVAGVYDAATPSIARMLDGAENKLIPVDNWALFAEKGGIQGSISWYPVETITQVLAHLTSAYEFVKNQLFEVTGMADIIRGSTNEYETAAAQQIKAQFASVRMNGFQRDVATFVRDAVRIIGELMVQMYSDQKLSQICGQLPQEDQQFVQPALQILRNDFMSSYSIDIQADSLTQADWGLEQKQRMEYTQTLSTFLQSALPVVQAAPAMGPIFAGIIKFISVGFKGSTELEGVLDAGLQALAQQAQDAQQNPKPSPEEIKAQTAQQESQARINEINAKTQARLQEQQSELAFKQQMFAMEMDHKSQMHAMEMQHRQEIAQMEAAQNQARFVQERVQDAKDSEQARQLKAEKAAASIATAGNPEEM